MSKQTRSVRATLTEQQSPPGAGRIRVVGPNPAMDRLQVLPHLAPHEVNRAVETTSLPGGKSLIVARTARRLGIVPVLYGFLGGNIGAFVRQGCLTLGMEDRHSDTAEETRITTVLIEQDTGRSTVVNEKGPIISRQEQDHLRKQIIQDSRSGDFVALTGSLPQGVTADFYGQMVPVIQATGARVILDASGEALRLGAAAAPWAVKCNADEFAVMRDGNLPFENEQTLLEAMDAQLQAGTSLVIITLGAHGLIASTRECIWRVQPPAVTAINPTGSGDTFLGAFLVACLQGHQIGEALVLGTAAAAANAASLEPDLGTSPDLGDFVAAVTTSTSLPSQNVRAAL